MIREEHLQQYWRNHAEGLTSLKTVCGQVLSICDVGNFNYDQGPDFVDARIKVGAVEWAGNVELHIRTSDWTKHAHQHDENYHTIILHVVWINDYDEYHISPILELSKFVCIEDLMIRDEVNILYQFPCSSNYKFTIVVDEHKALHDLGIERLMRRKEEVMHLFRVHKYDYSSVLWRLIFRSFGRSTNADSFEKLFLSIPIHVLRLYAFDQHSIESLLFGQSSLLQNDFKDEYPRALYKNYQVLSQRHGLNPINEKMKFLRMRPRNFPTIRLAQLAVFFHQHMSLFNSLLHIEEIKDLVKIFNITPHSYWHNHFVFEKASIEQVKEVGYSIRQQIILNAFIPLLMGYGQTHCDFSSVQKAKQWLTALKPEDDAMVQSFNSLGFRAKSIIDSQALHELYNRNCITLKCEDCIRGKAIKEGFTN
jgi:hypothetical protein